MSGRPVTAIPLAYLSAAGQAAIAKRAAEIRRDLEERRKERELQELTPAGLRNPQPATGSTS